MNATNDVRFKETMDPIGRLNQIEHPWEASVPDRIHLPDQA